MPKSNYTLQLTENSSCPECHEKVDLLCRIDGDIDRHPWFYICWWCETVYEVAKGKVLRGSETGHYVVEGPPNNFEDGAPVPATPHEGGGAIPLPSSGELEEEEADRQRSYPDNE